MHGNKLEPLKEEKQIIFLRVLKDVLNFSAISI
jgi:hypothetical protein